MAGENTDRLSPEFALVEALRTVPVLQLPYGEAKVAAMQPKKDWRAPFVFYIPTEDGEEETLEGPSGLQSFTAQLHFVGASHRGMQNLCQRSKKALRGMQGETYRTDPAEAELPQGAVLIEYADLQQASPDLYEAEVGYYRRVYTLRIHYQTEEVHEEVPSA